MDEILAYNNSDTSYGPQLNMGDLASAMDQIKSAEATGSGYEQNNLAFYLGETGDIDGETLSNPLLSETAYGGETGSIFIPNLLRTSKSDTLASLGLDATDGETLGSSGIGYDGFSLASKSTGPAPNKPDNSVIAQTSTGDFGLDALLGGAAVFTGVWGAVTNSTSNSNPSKAMPATSTGTKEKTAAPICEAKVEVTQDIKTGELSPAGRIPASTTLTQKVTITNSAGGAAAYDGKTDIRTEPLSADPNGQSVFASFPIVVYGQGPTINGIKKDIYNTQHILMNSDKGYFVNTELTTVRGAGGCETPSGQFIPMTIKGETNKYLNGLKVGSYKF